MIFTLKKLWHYLIALALLLDFKFAVGSQQDYPFKLIARAEASSQVIFAQNSGHAPILATVNLLNPVSIDRPSPISIIVPSGETITVASLHVTVPGKKFSVGTNAGQLQHVGSNPSTLTSDFSDTLPTAAFISGQNKLTYTYVVTSVSADNVESASSPAVIAQDSVVPTATIPTALAATYTITFSEPVDEVSAITLSNYVLTQGAAGSVPTVSSAEVNIGLTAVTLNLSATTATGNILTITGVNDIAGNTMTSVNRTF